MITLEAGENRRKDNRDTSQVIQQRSLIRVLTKSLNATIYLKLLLQQKSKCPHSPRYTAQCQDSLHNAITWKDNGVSSKCSFVSATELQRTEQVFGSMYKKYI